MIYIKKSFEDALIRHQQELINKGYKILDITLIHNGYHDGFAYFIKYTEKEVQNDLNHWTNQTA